MKGVRQTAPELQPIKFAHIYISEYKQRSVGTEAVYHFAMMHSQWNLLRSMHGAEQRSWPFLEV